MEDLFFGSCFACLNEFVVQLKKPAIIYYLQYRLNLYYYTKLSHHKYHHLVNKIKLTLIKFNKFSYLNNRFFPYQSNQFIQLFSKFSAIKASKKNMNNFDNFDVSKKDKMNFNLLVSCINLLIIQVGQMPQMSNLSKWKTILPNDLLQQSVEDNNQYDYHEQKMLIINPKESSLSPAITTVNAKIGRHTSQSIQSYPYQVNSVLVKLFLLINLLSLASSNNIFMSISSTNSSVGVLSNYTINFNRSLNSLGQTIASSNLNSNYQIAVVFDAAFNLNSSISMIPNNYTVSVSSQTVVLTLSSAISSIQILSFINPIASSNPFKITLNFYNSLASNVVIDTCSASITFTSLSLAASTITYQFYPGNVSTKSNVTMTMVPFLWIQSKMQVQLTLLNFWVNNMLNVTSNLVLNSMSYCVPTCVINNMGSFFTVQISGLTLVNNTLSFIIYNILSPATLQLADTITIQIVETTYNSNFQIGYLPVGAAYPNNLQIVSAATTSLIGQMTTLSLTCTSQDLFSTSDTITITMNTHVAMASQITINNPLVASNDFSIQQNSIITLSNFQLVTNIASQFSALITITNISSQASVKPVHFNTISFYRNGYLYDQSQFSFAVNIATISNISLTLANTNANANTNLTISILFSVGVISTDYLYISMDYAISVSNCSVVGCSNCICAIAPANPSSGIYTNTLRITGFSITNSSSSTVVKNITVLAAIKNPISSNYTIFMTSTDQQNFTKQTGNQSFPTITQSSISSSVLSLVSSSNMVYDTTNFTITLNLTNYSLVNGWMILKFDPIMTLIDSTNPFCLVNGNNGMCNLTLSNDSLMANISVSLLTSIYVVTINNLRNPNSSKFYSIQAALSNINNIVYYTIVSSNFQATQPYLITPQVTSQNCNNSQSNTLKIVFPFLPFQPTNALMIDDTSAASFSGQKILQKITYPMAFNSTVTINIVNMYSLQPSYYQFLVVTNDLLYNIFSVTFTISNCNPSTLPIINYQFTGLPEDPGTLTLVINQVYSQNNAGNAINQINYVTILFPNQFSQNISIQSNAITVSQLSPRLFNLTVGTTQPITLTIWGFTTTLSGIFAISTYSLSQSTNSQLNYLISTNNNTVGYSLSLLTTCVFPCKYCSSINKNICLQCYSSAITTQSYLDTSSNSCVSPTSCPSSTYPNSTNNSCIICPVQCATCTSSTNCTSCTANYYLFSNSCLTSCPSEYYPITLSQTCGNCNSTNNTARCQTCVTINVCTSCLFPYYFNFILSTCVSACSSSEIVLNSTCFACTSFCQTCQGALSNCTSCVTGQYLLLNTCMAACPSPYVPSPTINICVNCSTSCYTCTNSPSVCTSCTYPLKLMNSTCITNCPTGYFTYEYNNISLGCILCSSQCSTCSSLTYCLSCVSGLFFYNNSCLYVCPLATFNQNITNNLTTTPVCLPCSTSCLTCTSIAYCAQCQNGYYITSTSNGSICVSICGTSMYLSGNTCGSCSSNCLNCISATVCLACSVPYSLFNNSCVASCGTGLINILSSVVLPSSNSTSFICKQCNQIYQNCNNCTNLTCTNCSTGYILNYDKTCVIFCPSGYLNITNSCVSCSKQCAICSYSQSNCTSCSSGYLLYYNSTSLNYQCLTQCPQSTFIAGGVCTICTFPCLTCINSSTQCTSCKSGVYSLTMNGVFQCVSACPSNYYVYQSNCVQCANQCAICDSNGCKQCGPSYYSSLGQQIGGINYYNCYSSCPSNLPFLVNQTCMQCSLNCIVCNSNACLQCSTGLVSYGQYCLPLCPPGYVAQSGVCIIPNGTTTNSNSTTNLTNSTTSTSTITVPVPFSIATVSLILCIALSRLIHSITSVSLALFGLISVLTIICNVYYLIISLINWTMLSPFNMYVIILIAGLVINYVANIVFLFISRSTLLKDEGFICWIQGHVRLVKQSKIVQLSHQYLQDHLTSQFSSGHKKVPDKMSTYSCFWNCFLIVGSVTSHNAYVILFSKLFSLNIFRATVESIHTFSILNYVWITAIFSHLICFISGIIKAAEISSKNSSYLAEIYESVDLIFLNFLCLMLGLLLLRKNKQLWEKEDGQSHHDEANSTKKVIFDHQSHLVNMSNQVESQEEVNGKIMNIFGESSIGNQVPEAEYKSSTNQEGSQMFFQKQSCENLDDSAEIKLDNNIVWIQVNPADMMPQMVERNQSIAINDGANNVLQNKDNTLLVPDTQLERIKSNQYDQSDGHTSYEADEPQSNNNSQSQSIRKEIQDENDWQLGDMGQKKTDQKGVSARLGQIRINQSNKNLTKDNNQALDAKSVERQSVKEQSDKNEQYDDFQYQPEQKVIMQADTLQMESMSPIDEKEIQFERQASGDDQNQQKKSSTQQIIKQQTSPQNMQQSSKRPKRNNKLNSQRIRYEQRSDKKITLQKQSARISGLQQLFNEYYQTSPPKTKPEVVENIFKRQSFVIHQSFDEDGDQYKPSQAKSQIRKSLSSEDFRNELNQRESAKFQEVQRYETIKQQRQEEEPNKPHYNNLSNSKREKNSEASLKNSIYKSINIAKIDNRLGTKSNLKKTQIKIRSLGKDNKVIRSKSVLAQNKIIEFGNEHKDIWKSRLTSIQPGQNVKETTHLIERKSKLAHMKAQLQSIYLTSK